jgi:hypothetical protein
MHEYGSKKPFKNWKIITNSQEFIKHLSKAVKIPADDLFIEIRRGTSKNHINGTYVHPTLVTHIAYWLSPEFAVKIGLWIDEWKKNSSENDAKYWVAVSTSKPSFNDQREKAIVEKLNKTIKGETENFVSNGRIDILTKNEIIEVKVGELYKHTLGQILAYDLYYPNRKKIIYLFDISKHHLTEAKKLYKKYDVELRIVKD